ncbi:MAG: hypothetical protein Q8P57_01725 [Candidatus Pacearchaeota archaeon]|nr:hypothetical protein [Candidatus Pacearchaeota archaeon]
MSLLKNKDGALELSIGTIVIIVIGMSMLILGLVLVRSIFTGAIGSVDEINEGVQAKIQELFPNEGGNLAVLLGSDNVAKVKPGERFNVAIGAQHERGEQVARDTILYRVELDTNSNDNCVKVLGERRTEDLFVTPVNAWNAFDTFRSSTAFALIEIDVPTGTQRCTQKVNIDIKLKEETAPFEGDFFLLEIKKEGIF